MKTILRAERAVGMPVVRVTVRRMHPTDGRIVDSSEALVANDRGDEPILTPMRAAAFLIDWMRIDEGDVLEVRAELDL